MNDCLADEFGRRFAYLRLSITDVCNFRCEYCLPRGYRGNAHGFLTSAEIQRLLSGFAGLGIRKLRLTGGEPLVRRDILDICHVATATDGIEKMALTTNGYRLHSMALPLRDAGIDAINVSLDSLSPVGFRRITGDSRHAKVIDGIETALSVGVPTVKVNTVLLSGLNDHEVPQFIEYVRERPLTIRFIELMQTAGNVDYFRHRHVRSTDIANHLRKSGWKQVAREITDGPAIEFTHPDYRGRIGLIAPYARDFCKDCNRLRVTARGGLRLCLFGNGVHDLRPYLQRSSDRDVLQQKVVKLLSRKPGSHSLHQGDCGDMPNLAAIGG